MSEIARLSAVEYWKVQRAANGGMSLTAEEQKALTAAVVKLAARQRLDADNSRLDSKLDALERQVSDLTEKIERMQWDQRMARSADPGLRSAAAARLREG